MEGIICQKHIKMQYQLLIRGQHHIYYSRSKVRDSDLKHYRQLTPAVTNLAYG